MLSLLVAIPAMLSCSSDDNEPSITPTLSGSMTDDDGNEYKWVRIGNLDWMAENYRGGEAWFYQSYTSDNGYVNYLEADDEDEEYEYMEKHGNYYTYEQAMEQAPEGWRLPTDADWKQLEIALGMSAANADKEGWRPGAAFLMKNEAAGLGFSFPGQLASYSTSYVEKYHRSDYGYYWSSTIDQTKSMQSAFIRKITPSQNAVYRCADRTNNVYLSVRYCRNSEK